MTAQHKIIAAFDSAAPHYDAAASLQQQVAQQLINNATTSTPQNILDIGCGTGCVTRLAALRWPQAHITALDASPHMLEQVRKNIPHIRTLQSDAAHIDDTTKYDLILSSMVLHWLPNPRAVLQNWLNLLAPNGQLHVALPVAGSLREWQSLCAANNISDGTWKFPASTFADGIMTAQIHPHPATYPTLHDFLKNMKATGAHSAHSGHTPTPLPQMRQLLNDRGQVFTATYDIAYLAYTRN